METRANYVLIGLFTLAVIAGAFGFVYWLSRTTDGGVRVAYRVIFDGSVSGLRAGGPVLFNGIRVGEVRSVRIDPRAPGKVEVTIGIDSSVPVRSDTRAGLEFQGFTGNVSLALRGGTVTAPPLTASPGELPTLVAEPTAMQDLAQGARELMSRADAILRRIDNVFADNEEGVRSAIRNIDTFTATLARNSENVDELFKNASELAKKLNEMSGRIEGVLASVENLTGGPETKGAISEITEAARAIRKFADNLDRRTAEMSAGLGRFTGQGLREFEQLAADGRRTLAELDRAIRNLDRNPSRIIFGGGTAVPEFSGRR
jgi:phospholipid/cholesterol/gamma-HCH transport system substrate-binding protein